MKIDANSIFQESRRRALDSRALAPATKYHLAAIDGYIDMLCDASKKDTNQVNEENGLTPTLLAAFSGQLDALRILVGRGGDPERTSLEGSTALHLAASRNHLNCASFLVNFGVNMWALDNDLHTAKDIAAMGQKKEVLDYLDQMMAKQSALNTKNVQKLKEKAKVAAEKRLKQLRKAQLKAIKQVEKDERYLVKLSNNRPLLKAAHSIGDIKLVGRGHHHHPDLGSHISYSPSEASSSSASSASARSHHQHLQRQHAAGCAIRPGGSRLSGKSPSISNLISHKLQMDLLGSRQHSKLNFSHRSTTDESSSSAYSSSSVSSISYLSSCSALHPQPAPAGPATSGQNTGASHHSKPHALVAAGHDNGPPRPKYSDLVAVKGTESARLHGSQQLSTASAKKDKEAPRDKKSGASKKAAGSLEQQQQSLKSSTASMLKTKLWGVGGASRKVHLKRMMQANHLHNAQSTSDLSTTGRPSSQAENSRLAPSSNSQEPSGSQSSSRLDSIVSIKENLTASGKQRQLSLATDTKLATSDDSSRNQRLAEPRAAIDAPPPPSSIAWPPAPAMTRAVSEPDFSAALRADTDSEDGDGDDDDINMNTHDREKCDLFSIGPEDDRIGYCSGRDSVNAATCDNSQQVDVQSVANEVGQAKESRSGEREQTCQVTRTSTGDRDESQHHLLTRCLSQLKMRHEEIIAAKHRDTPNCLHSPSKMTNKEQQQVVVTAHVNTSAALLGASSDELLQHQLTAGQFPLRPSAIKQKQQQLLQSGCLLGANQKSEQQVVAGDQDKHSTSSQFHNCATKSSANSVDSIGSASSFAKRNSRTPSTSSSVASSMATTTATATTAASTNPKSSSEDNSRSSSSAGQTRCKQQADTRLQDDNKQAGDDAQSVALAKAGFCRATSDEETIETFLMSSGLLDLSPVFAKEKIDLEALMLLSEEDLKSLNILLGPRRKLLKAIEDKRTRLAYSSIPSESFSQAAMARYVMVDTQL